MKIEYNNHNINIYNNSDKQHEYEVRTNEKTIEKGIINNGEHKTIKVITNPRLRYSWTAKIDVYIDNELAFGKIIKSSEV